MMKIKPPEAMDLGLPLTRNSKTRIFSIRMESDNLIAIIIEDAILNKNPINN